MRDITNEYGNSVFRIIELKEQIGALQHEYEAWLTQRRELDSQLKQNEENYKLKRKLLNQKRQKVADAMEQIWQKLQPLEKECRACENESAVLQVKAEKHEALREEARLWSEQCKAKDARHQQSLKERKQRELKEAVKAALQEMNGPKAD